MDKTIKQYLESNARYYRNIASDFDNYCPKNELYTGYAKMCEEMLHDLSDETLAQPIVFRKFNYCGECARYNNFHHNCRDCSGNEIRCLIFKNTEACSCFERKDSHEEKGCSI